MTIYKYPITLRCEISMPRGAKILAVQTQRQSPVLWALVNPANTLEARQFICYATGEELPTNPGNYIATFQVCGGAYVFHCFEL